MAEPLDDVPAELFARLAADPLAAHLGIDLEQVRPGYARAAMTVSPQLLNTDGTVAVAQDVHTEFLTPGSPGERLVAEGTELHRSGRTAVYRIDARAGDGRLVAT